MIIREFAQSSKILKLILYNKLKKKRKTDNVHCISFCIIVISVYIL